MATSIAILLLALPALTVRVWMASTFPSYLSGSFAQDIIFAVAWCTLLACVARWRLLHAASVPIAFVAYLAWLFLVLGEGVSYDLQADTFNARFFANLSFANLGTGVRAFPLMIGGGLALLALMVVVCAALFARERAAGRCQRAGVRSGPAIVVIVILLLTVLGVDSAPRRLIHYVSHVQQSVHFADTAQGRAVARQLDLHPVSPKGLVAAPGRNLVLIYLESLERVYWDPKVFPGLTPNLDRLRGEGLDFSGFDQFSGAGYTIAGMFASQCGVPLFSSPFAELDGAASNDNSASTFHPKIACLGNVLRKAGYTQVYMGGAPMRFSNKGLFYRLHGYDEVLGLRQLEASHGDALPQAGWGLYDSALFEVALAEYRKLEASRKPFNLSLITLDTHPPHGRPSPGCPVYAGSDNRMLQAVHCTDALVGRFIDDLRRSPGWRQTVVVIMSDHLMMRNDAEPLYPKGYHRQPAFVVLNAGHGVRPVRMFHMDVAPTVLDLLGVRTNATFIAGRDRSATDARGSGLVDDGITDSVLRKALWSRANEFELCKRGTLISARSNDAFDVGGRELALSYHGEPQVGIRDGQVMDFFIDNANATLLLADDASQPALLKARGDASVLTIRGRTGTPPAGKRFTVDWVGRSGASAHVAEVGSLRGLTIASPRCGELMAEADAAAPGRAYDFSDAFKVTTVEPPLLPAAPRAAEFDHPDAAAFETGYGWLEPRPWGSSTLGDASALAFRLPRGLCDGAMLRMRVDPYLPPARPDLDAQVWVNGKPVATWEFHANGKFSTNSRGIGDDHEVVVVDAPVDTGGTCQAHVTLRFSRPGAASPPYPRAEDPRPLQLRVVDMQVLPAAASK